MYLQNVLIKFYGYMQVCGNRVNFYFELFAYGYQ
ncbi:hypothetical protein M2103_001916 [Ereboglobus sp. PH5-5]|nr:hypothetical protein [Ereboglobus sp. PH5-5]